MEYGAIDLHKKESQIRILTEDGEIVDRRIATTRERLTSMFWGRSRMRILLEAADESADFGRAGAGGCAKPWSYRRDGRKRAIPHAVVLHGDRDCDRAGVERRVSPARDIDTGAWRAQISRVPRVPAGGD